MKEEYRKKYQSSLAEWLLYHQRNVHFKYKYCGLDMQKNPFDIMVYMEIIGEIKPDYIIEIGGAGGGTALWLCHQLDVFDNGTVISVDINHGGFHAEHERLVKVTGDSTLPDTAGKVKDIIHEGATCLVIHDGSHKKEDIKKDFMLYSPFVTVDSYFIIEDGIMDVFDWKDHRTAGHDCGLYAAIELAQENSDFIIDNAREKYIMTYNPMGYLRRIE